MHCLSCGHDNPDENQFCGQCGIALASPARSFRSGTAEEAYAEWPHGGDPLYDAPSMSMDQPMYQRAYWGILATSIIMVIFGIYIATLVFWVGAFMVLLISLGMGFFLLRLREGREYVERGRPPNLR